MATEEEEEEEEEESCGRLILLEDGSRFDLDQLETDQLLGDLKEWDYPIFDLLDRYTHSILSAVSFNSLWVKLIPPRRSGNSLLPSGFL